MENPNEYDDGAYTSARMELDGAVYDLWQAGATEDDIKEAFENAIDNATKD